jgi:hypothetical protein
MDKLCERLLICVSAHATADRRRSVESKADRPKERALARAVVTDDQNAVGMAIAMV